MDITLSIDEDVFSRARQVAKAMNKNINQLIQEYLLQLAVMENEEFNKPRQPGALVGCLKIADDFDAPLPESIVSAFRGEQP